MNITVYCGAAEGQDPEFIARARELGAWMASKGHTLIYGAGNSGMMGAVSDALIEGGGEAIGVTPRFFILAEETRDDLTEVVISDDMSTRRNWMIDNGDAYIALPGGMGTLDEITEVMTYKRLGLLGKVNKPVMIYNVNGYYDRFFSFLDDMRDQSFCRQLDRDNVIEAKCLEDIIRALEIAGSIDETRTSKYDE
ncbi:MAG: TIGR00730 family Rossman fold protein [Mogibacterium sp.]|nr:TIGR00730 family Rossman fold protein [Mogibacterium sp.]